MSQLIIGLGNKARHGKDTFAAAVDSYFARMDAAAARHGLAKYRPVFIQKLAFADALYREVSEFLGREVGHYWVNKEAHNIKIDGVLLPDWVQPDPNPEKSTRAPYGKHPKLLQWWGTEYRRSQDPEYWVKQWKAAINPKADIILTTDMRFLNEAVAIKSVGGYTVQVNRLTEAGTLFVDPSRDANHISETELDLYNYDFKLFVKNGHQILTEEWAVTLVHYLRALKGHK